MPFTVSPSSYRGGDYLFQGITNAAQGITGAIQHFSDVSNQAAQSDALMQYLSQQQDPTTGKPIIDQKALQAYQNHSMQQRAYVAGGTQAGMALVQALQHGGYANRETLAKTNLYQAQAANANVGGGVPQAGSVNIGGRKVNFIQTPHGGVQVVPDQPGTPGQVIYDPNTKKAIGFFGQDGKPIRYQSGNPMDLNALFGGGGDNQPTAAPAAEAGGGTDTGAQPTDQAYSAQGDPGNLPPMYRQQPAGQGGGAQATAQTSNVRVLHPDGKTVGYIPASQLPVALNQGYRQL